MDLAPSAPQRIANGYPLSAGPIIAHGPPEQEIPMLCRTGGTRRGRRTRPLLRTPLEILQLLTPVAHCLG